MRRVGIVGKIVFVSAEEYRWLTDCDRLTVEKEVWATFSTRKLQTVQLFETYPDRYCNMILLTADFTHKNENEHIVTPHRRSDQQ